MNVIAFARKPVCGAWSEAELKTVAAALNLAGRDWETGTTESGDVQLYLLGPRPDQACELCLSRIGCRYILEDGAGRLLFDHVNLALVAQQARGALRRTNWWLVARVVVLWCTIRHVIHDKIEPLLTESEELLVHLTPQLAAFA
jgi:hypothetical protein